MSIATAKVKEIAVSLSEHAVPWAPRRNDALTTAIFNTFGDGEWEVFAYEDHHDVRIHTEWNDNGDIQVWTIVDGGAKDITVDMRTGGHKGIDLAADIVRPFLDGRELLILNMTNVYFLELDLTV